MRARLIAVVVLAASMLSTAKAGPITQDPCPGTASVQTWKQLGNDTLENLLIDGSSLWISDQSADSIRRFSPDGTEAPAAKELTGAGVPVGWRLVRMG